MIKKDKDITDEEYEKIHEPFNRNLKNYMNTYIIPEVLAFQLANSHFRKCLCESTLEQHCNSMLDVFNCYDRKELKKILLPTVIILEIKYNLVISNVNPLRFENFV